MKIESKSPDESGGSGGRQRLVSLKCVPHARSEPISIPSSSSSSSSPDHFFPSASPPSCPSPGFLSSSCKQAFRSKPFATTPIGGSPMPVRRDQVSQSWTGSDSDPEADQVPPLLCVSPSEVLGPFAGSFEESLVAGRMANYPSVVYQGFTADIGVHGKNRRGKVVAPAHLKLSFSSRVYFHVSKNTPYVGTIHLEQPYELPPVGVVQLVVFNPMKTPLKTFLVKYDVSDMPLNTKTFVRQTIHSSRPRTLQYAVQLRIICVANARRRRNRRHSYPEHCSSVASVRSPGADGGYHHQDQEDTPFAPYQIEMDINEAQPRPYDARTPAQTPFPVSKAKYSPASQQTEDRRRQRRKKYYLFHKIRVVFATRAPDESSSLQVNYQTANNPKYFALNFEDQALVQGMMDLRVSAP